MDRRAFLTCLGSAVLAPLAAEAQQRSKVYRIGYLHPGVIRGTAISMGFLEGLRELGYVDGQNLAIEFREAEGQITRLPGLAADLVRMNVDVIVAGTNLAAFAAKEATTTIPIVVIGSHGAVENGLVASMAQPGANITGVESLAPELDAKRMELLRELLPRARRVAYLHNPDDKGSIPHLNWTGTAARQLGFTILAVPVRNANEFQAAFATITREDVDALLTMTDPLTFSQRKQIVAFALNARVPALYEFREFAALGGLVAYGPNLLDMARRAATYVDRILKGAKPGNLPLEQPTKFELIINLKTAQALGLTIPPIVLVRADEVIQ